MNEFVNAWQVPHMRTVYEDAAGNLTVKEGGNANWRNNNPGNIRYGEFARRHGAIGSMKLNPGDKSKMAIFPSVEKSRKAKEILIRNNKKYIDNTLEGMMREYSPKSENPNIETTINSISKNLGLPRNTPVKSIEANPEKFQELMNQIEIHEGTKVGKEYTFPNGTQENNKLKELRPDASYANEKSDGRDTSSSSKKSSGQGGPASPKKTAMLGDRDILGRSVADIEENEINGLIGSSAYQNVAHVLYPAVRQKVSDWYAHHYGNDVLETDATGKTIKPFLKTKPTRDVQVRAHDRKSGKVHVHAYARSSPKGQ